MKTIDEIFKLYCDERHSSFRQEIKEDSYIHIRHFISYCKESCYTDYIDQGIIEDWCYRRERESPERYKTRLASIRNFISFAKRNGYIDAECPKQEAAKVRNKRQKTEKPFAKSAISQYIEEYIDFLRNTDRYNKNMNTIFASLNNLYIQDYPNAETLTDDMITAILDKKLAKRTLRSNMFYMQVKRFLEYANFKGYINVRIPPYERVKYKKLRFPYPFSDQELKDFFYQIDHIPALRFEDYHSYKFRRLKVSTFFRLLYSTGMRTNEARMLQREDVDLDNGIINIRQTKGYHQHRVALHSSMLEVLKKYDKVMDEIMPNRRVFFPSPEDTEHFPYWQAEMFNIAWNKISKEDARPYDFRSNYAVRNINSWKLGEPKWIDKFAYLSRSMGHNDLQSTAYYYQLVPMFREKLEQQTGENLKKLMPDMSDFLHDDYDD